MASITLMPSGRYRAHVFKHGVRQSKVFRTKREASNWSAIQEARITRDTSARADTKRKAEGLPLIRIEAYFGPGLYVLYQGEEISYVGKSSNVMSRILSHSGKGRDFSHFAVIPYPEDSLAEKERELIATLCPRQNRA